ncbi:Mpo1-like protein [Pseudoalteromonas fenneropenaei]|uniref:Mpo1-like protein n=1 Tax=Pseudoalteromonas fenneropenaei TaxID=1737459 RepID=A0ABV7CIY6_9GAMM
MSTQPQSFKSFAEFYPYYLAEHSHPICRSLHYIGSTLVILLALAALGWQDWRFAAAMPLAGYGFAWLGHFGFEHNKPATFKYPLYSLWGDWVMYGQFLRGLLRAA